MPLEIEQILQDALNSSQTTKQKKSVLKQDDLKRISQIIDRVEDKNNIGVLSVLITLLVKKIADPNQDIRLHQAAMENGFSGRSLDTKYITPFLRKNNFPYMVSGSGWLTRSLEHRAPYTMDYPGQIKPKYIKLGFLHLVDQIECKSEFSKACLIEIFKQLVLFRDKSQNVALSRPKNKSIGAVVSLLEKLWGSKTAGLSRVPVIAVFAAYKCLIKEIDRYHGHELLPLLPHNAADQKTGRSGDIDLAYNSKTVEAVEIKHGIPIDSVLVSSAIEKIKRTSVKRYYILSTNEMLYDIETITSLTIAAKTNHGCEIIVNGVAATIRYYLRLISNTDDFIEHFVSVMEQDSGISYKIKMDWDKLQTNN